MSKKRKGKSGISNVTKVLLALVSVLLITVVSLFILNRFEIQFDMHDADVVHVEYGSEYQDPSVSASYSGTIFKFIHHDIDVEKDISQVDTNTLGEYTVTYKASYKKLTETVTRKVIVEDKTAPTITLTSNEDSYTPYDHPYEEEGYSASDNYDGDITDKVQSEEKDGVVYYTVTDSQGNTGSAERKIIYDDREGPQITFDDGEDVSIYVSESFQDQYHAEDDVDGDITSQVEIDGYVDTNTVGDYVLTYTVTDAHGNTSVKTKTVHVKARPVNDPDPYESSKTIYLTFDDGPGPYTDELLNILDAYNVKATFFTTSAYPGYAYCIAEEYQRGHTVAVHSATHNYGLIYASTDAYWNDFNIQNELIYQETGQYTTMFRFPGGSSNTVSRNYCTGIMSTLADQAAQYGYTYYDWNVTSGDAGETTDTTTVYYNVINGIQANTNHGHASVVLQHDVKGFSVDAVESIIQWGLENGYTFSALYPGSMTAHHGINN